MTERDFKFPEVKQAFLETIKETTKELYRPREEGDSALKVFFKIGRWETFNSVFELGLEYGLTHKDIFDAIIEATPIGLKQEYFSETIVDLFSIEASLLSTEDLEKLAEKHKLKLQ